MFDFQSSYATRTQDREVGVMDMNAVAASATVIKGVKEEDPGRAALASADWGERPDINPGGAGSLGSFGSNA
jgi:hypothetical protein